MNRRPGGAESPGSAVIVTSVIAPRLAASRGDALLRSHGAPPFAVGTGVTDTLFAVARHGGRHRAEDRTEPRRLPPFEGGMAHAFRMAVRPAANRQPISSRPRYPRHGEACFEVTPSVRHRERLTATVAANSGAANRASPLGTACYHLRFHMNRDDIDRRGRWGCLREPRAVYFNTYLAIYANRQSLFSSRELARSRRRRSV